MSNLSRLDEIESRVEFQDATIAALNDEIVRQQARIIELQKSLESLVQRLAEPAHELPAGDEPPPPHY